MLHRAAKLILRVTVILFAIRFLFGWVHANIDSYFYWAIGEFFRTGSYPFQEPFVYTKPTTIAPPLYGVFFILSQNVSHAEILLHGLQLILLAATSYLLYRVLQLHLKKPASLIISCLFALYPTNLIYAANVMTENPSQFLLMLWVYFITYGVVTKRPRFIAAALLVSSVATLVKYNLSVYVVFAGIMLASHIKRMKWPDYAMSALSVVLLVSWVVVNHQITNTWGLYDTKGTQLYNQFVAQTRLLPPESHPAVIRMRSLLPPGTDIAVPYWDIQEQLSNNLSHEWTQVDKVLFDVGWASVRTHPLVYILHSLKNYARIHYDHVPHWRNIGNIGMSGLNGTDVPFCGRLGAVTTCVPIVMTPWSNRTWNAFVRVEMKVFELLAAPVFFLILLPSLCWALFRGSEISRLYALMYLAGTVPIAFTIHPDPRYVVPFYPLAVLLVTAVAKEIYTHHAL